MTARGIPAQDRDGVRVFAARLTPDELQRDKSRLVADLLTDQTPPVDLTPFSPQRF
mgnify:CR=1 FL=1